MINFEQSKQKQEKLLKLLKEIANAQLVSDEEIEPFINTLKDIYSNNFRHMYSAFFPLITELVEMFGKDVAENLPEQIKVLMRWLEDRNITEDGEWENIYFNLAKLSDHLDLEVGRYNQFYVQDVRYKDLKKHYTELEEQLDKAKRSVTSIHIDTIAVLSIFSAIVLAFSGGLGYIGSVLSGVGEASFFKLAFFVLLCGFIIINTIYIMLSIVEKIVNRHTGIEGAEHSNSMRKVNLCVIWINIVIVGLLCIDIIAWFVAPWILTLRNNLFL